jgi:hypothetical protein
MMTGSLSGCYSAIFGRSGNSHAGFHWARIFGCNITAQIAKTLHENCLNACSTPNYLVSGPYPPGTIYFIPVGGAIL